jgi:hypothetical protein
MPEATSIEAWRKTFGEHTGFDSGRTGGGDRIPESVESEQ